MILFHVTTAKKAAKYRKGGAILKPVRGFTTLQGAMAWAMKCGRKVIYQIEADDAVCHKLPDHHNQWGEAWWVDHDVWMKSCKCVFSAEYDA